MAYLENKQPGNLAEVAAELVPTGLHQPTMGIDEWYPERELDDPAASVRRAIRDALFDEALSSGLKQRIAEMRERLSRLEGSAEKKRSWAATIMQRFDLAKIKEPDFTASLRPAPPRVIILAEHQITDDFLKAQPPKLDKQAILGALKSGVPVPGATLSNQESVLSVRTK